VLSQGQAGQGNVQFAGHVAGFEDGPGSHFIGGGPPGGGGQDPRAPEPATVVVWSLLGAMTVGACYLRRGRRAA
jgi:hypothetical protein